jgi:heterodisulfide reductase subunit B
MGIKMDKESIKKSIKTMVRESRFNQISNCCYMCGESNPKILRKMEKHHIDGRKNSDEVVSLCPNCHIKITYVQNSISPIKRSSISNIDKLGFRLLSHGAILEQIGIQQQEIGREILGNGSIRESINKS